MGQHNVKDITGMRFGKLVVLEFSHIGKHRKSHWKCICDCGNEFITSSSAIKSGTTKSCGCLVKETNSLPNGMAGLNKLFYTYKTGAKRREIEFLLCLDEFHRLTSLNCYYCGNPPSAIAKNGAKFKPNGNYIYNGIDRIDNTKGYVEGNVVPCCSNCNYAKRDMSYVQFKNWIMSVTDHLMSKNILSASLGK